MNPRTLPGFSRLLPIGLVLLISFYPLCRLLLVPAFPALAPPQMVPRGVNQGLLSATAALNSLRIGIEAGLSAVIPGLALAYVLERMHWRGARLLDICLWLLLLMPSYLLSTGWQLTAAAPFLADGPLYPMLFSEAGIVAMLALKGLPFACLSARMGWAAIGDDISAALRLHVRSRPRRAVILGRLMAPAAGSVFAVVFIEAISDFGIAATLGAHLHMPLVVYGVYAALARTPTDFAQASKFSLILILMASAAVLLHHLLNRHGGAKLSGRSRTVQRATPSPAAGLAAWAALGLLVGMAFVVPATALILRALAPGDASRLTDRDLLSLSYSTAYAFVGATLTVALVVAVLAKSSRPSPLAGRLFDAATLGAMAVPGIVLGAAYVIAFNGWIPLYSTPILLLVGFVATHLPSLSRFLAGPLGSTHANLGDAARLHGIGRWARLEIIHLPLMLRPLLWGWTIAFAGIFFELPLSSLLYPVGRAPIGVALLSLDETLRFGGEARLALLGVLLCLAIVGIVIVLLPRWMTSRQDEALPVGARL